MSFANALRDLIEEEGREVKHHYYERVEEDGREVWVEASTSPDTIIALPEETGPSFGFERNIREANLAARKDYFVKDTVENLRTGGGSDSSQIVDGDEKYILMVKDDLDNGVFKLVGWSNHE